MNTTPWQEKWASLLAVTPLHNPWTFQAVDPSGTLFSDPIPLPCTSASVTFDEAWAPHVQAGATLPLETGADMTLLDPRANVRLEIRAGYQDEPTATPDLQLLASLALRDRVARRPANTVDLRASSDEALVQDDIYRGGGLARTGINEWIENLLYLTTGQWLTLDSDFPAAHRPDLVADIDLPLDGSMWSPMLEPLEPINAQLYSTGRGVWRLRHRPDLLLLPDFELATGPGGLVEETETGIAREGEGWSNYVVVRHRWSTGTSSGDIRRWAQVADGPYGTAAAGRKALVFTRDTYATAQFVADSAAALLRRAFTKGRTASLTAPAMYWVRPGMTAAVILPGGDMERWLVTRVQFTYPDATMAVRLRRPEVGTITTGE